MINKEIYDKLVEYEHPLGTAYKANYVRALSSKALIIFAGITFPSFSCCSNIKVATLSYNGSLKSSFAI